MAEKKLLKRLFEGMAKTRNSLVSKLDDLFSGGSIDDEFYEELEEILITADIGVRTTNDIIEELQETVEEQKIKDPAKVKELLMNTIKQRMDLGENAYEFEDKKSVILVIGVNGVGKTTSIGKLAGQMKAKGKTVLLAAADTFRAGAIEQLDMWAKRADVSIIAHQEGSDPAAVIYDAVQSAKSKNTDILICDTAGRLHNKKNLMEELKKINRIIDKDYPEAYRETFIVLDGTTGQNALVQAREFMEAAKITGIILTKMDGTAKGGIAVAIQAELGVPVKYIGVGEQINDLQKFDAQSYVDALFTEAEFEEDETEISAAVVSETTDAAADIALAGADDEKEATAKEAQPAAAKEAQPAQETVGTGAGPDKAKTAEKTEAADNTEISDNTEAVDEEYGEIIDPDEFKKVFSSEFFRLSSTWDLLTEIFVDDNIYIDDDFYDKYSFK